MIRLARPWNWGLQHRRVIHATLAGCPVRAPRPSRIRQLDDPQHSVGADLACARKLKLASGGQGRSPMTELRSDMGHQVRPCLTLRCERTSLLTLGGVRGCQWLPRRGTTVLASARHETPSRPDGCLRCGRPAGVDPGGRGGAWGDLATPGVTPEGGLRGGPWFLPLPAGSAGATPSGQNRSNSVPTALERGFWSAPPAPVLNVRSNTVPDQKHLNIKARRGQCTSRTSSPPSTVSGLSRAA